MTAEQLEELLADLDGAEWDADGDYIVDHDGLDVCAVSSTDTHKRLILSAPSLARKVIAAERMAKALEDLIEYCGSSQMGCSTSDERAALAAYREASK